MPLTSPIPMQKTGAYETPPARSNPSLLTKSLKMGASPLATRRRRPSVTSQGLSHVSQSVPGPQSFRRRVPAGRDSDEDDGEIKGGASMSKNEKLDYFECEKCQKVYRHASCLVKHRWEHTTHWKEASKLLLSKHQQVQLLEAAAILKAASSGHSLPDEKSYWPAAVSPPTSGLLGAQSLNIDVLSSPRMPSTAMSPRMPISMSLAMSMSSPGPSPALERTATPLKDDDDDEMDMADGDSLAEDMFDMEIDDDERSTSVDEK